MTRDELLYHLGDMISGTVNAQWLILELLDRKGVLPKQEVIAEFERVLSILREGPGVHPPGRMVPLEHLIRALSRPHSDQEPPRWVPVVIPGGLDQEGS